MGIFGNWFGETEIERKHKENAIVVKTLKSKGKSKSPINITVGDIKSGTAIDSSGYANEVVIFLRRNKKDR